MNTPPTTGSSNQQVQDLRHLYRSVTRMARTDVVDTLLNHIAEDIINTTDLERLVVLYYDQQNKKLESRVSYGFDKVLEVNVPFSQVNGLLKRAYADREPLNVIKPKPEGDSKSKGAQKDSMQVKCGILKDNFRDQQRDKQRQKINICYKGVDNNHALDKLLNNKGQLRNYSILTYYQHDKTIESILGDASAFLIIPICDDHNFYGYVLANKPESDAPVSYEEARMATAIVNHSAMAIGRAMKHHEMIIRIAHQNEELSLHLEANEELKSFYESIIQGLRIGLITADINLKITHSNNAVKSLLGYPLKKLTGTQLTDLFDAEEEEIREIFSGGGKCIDPKTGYLSEFELICADQTKLPTEICFSIITNKEGKTAGLSCMFIDITQRKKMENNLARMDRLASLGELASGIAHEIRNPLAGIAAALQIIGKNFTQQDPDQEIFNEVFSQVKRLDEFIKNLLRFARPSNPKFEMLTIQHVIDNALFLVSNKISQKNIILTVDHGTDKQPLIEGDKGLLQQVFLNIIINALDATEDNGSLEIRTCWPEKSINTTSETAFSTPKVHNLTIAISDSGSGVDKANLEAIFNPFFTTKSQGTGLGLAIAHRIIEQHNGGLSVKSTTGKGTTFTITLPRLE